jgi:cytochrome P450
MSVQWDPFSWEAQHEPYPIYRRLRDESPVYYNTELDFWALTRYADVLKAHLDPTTFLSSHGVTLDGIEMGLPDGPLIVKDPPEHTVHRKIVSRVFTARRIGQLEPTIRDLAARLLDELVPRGQFDVVSEFATLLPLGIISNLLGLPVEYRDRIVELSDRMIHRGSGGDGVVTPDAASAREEMRTILQEVVEHRRRHPADDIVTMMIDAEIPDGDSVKHLSDVDIASKFLELVFAGHETVASLIPSAVVALSWYPEHRRALADNPGMLPKAVEEMLRWDPPSRYQGRWTSRDFHLHGQTIPANSRVLLVTGSATHDEREYEEPELFDIYRKIDTPVTFGRGVHHCIGHALARLEIGVAFEELLARIPDYQLDIGVERKICGNNRALARLPIRF